MSTKKEIVLKAFHNERPERIPVGFWFHFLKTPTKFNAGLLDPEVLKENLEGHRKFKQDFDPDFVKIMTDGYFFIPIEGKELSEIRIPAEKKAAYIADLTKLVSGVREIFGEDTLLFLNIFAPANALSFGYRKSYNDSTPYLQKFLVETPDALSAALDTIADGLVDVIKALVKPGLADGIYLSVTSFNGTIRDELYTKYISPSEKKILAAAKEASPDNILHICGYAGNKNSLSLYRDYDVEVVNWAVHAENLGLKEGKEYFGGKAVLGGFDNTTDSVLYKGTREEVEKAVEELLSDVGKEGVIIGADCTVPSDIDIERLNWVRDKAAALS